MKYSINSAAYRKLSAVSNIIHIRTGRVCISTVGLIKKAYSMTKTRLLTIAILLMLPSFSAAKWNDKEGKILEDTEWMKSSGEFGAQLVLIGDEKEFFKRWETPSRDVHLNTISQLQRGDSLITPIIFSGCYTNNEGNCNVVVDFNVLKPDGTSYADLNDIEVWIDKPAPPKGILELSVGYLKIIIEPEDSLGKYIVKANVTDRIKESSFMLTQEFTVTNVLPAKQNTSTSENKKTEAIKELGLWFTYYYKNPQPEDFEVKIKAMVDAGFFDKPSSITSLIMFLSEIFRQNEKVLPQWEKTFIELLSNI